MSRKDRRAHLQKDYQAPTQVVMFKVSNDRITEEVLVGDKIPEVSDADIAFPSRWRELLPPYNQLSKEDHNFNDPFHDAVSSLFFSGGRLSDYGIFPKEGNDLKKIMRYMRATLGDWGPKHEHKIGGIAHMLRKWCDYKKP